MAGTQLPQMSYPIPGHSQFLFLMFNKYSKYSSNLYPALYILWNCIAGEIESSVLEYPVVHWVIGYNGSLPIMTNNFFLPVFHGRLGVLCASTDKTGS